MDSRCSARIFIFLLFSNVLLQPPSTHAERLNLTNKIQFIGVPYFERYPSAGQTYARNIWDMIAYNGKIYLGAGNSSNVGPAPNAGPVPIISYDPKNNFLIKEFLTDEEQIDVFCEIGGDLYIPGHDPRESWNSGNYYTLPLNGSWKKHRNISGAIHTYALAMHKGNLFAALGSQDKKSIAVSFDLGKSWIQFSTGCNRIYAFLIVDERLYAAGTFYPETYAIEHNTQNSIANMPVLEFTDNNDFQVRKDLVLPKIFFPETDKKKIGISKIVKARQIGRKAIYLGARLHNDHQFLPFGAYIASSLEEDKIIVDRVPLPDGVVPWDLLVKGDSIYILGERKNRNKSEISVWRNKKNTNNWQELFYFEDTTFARSFEILDNTFYFSSGGEIGNVKRDNKEVLSKKTGEFFKIKAPE